MSQPCPCRGCTKAYQQGAADAAQRVERWFTEHPVYLEGPKGYHSEDEVVAAALGE